MYCSEYKIAVEYVNIDNNDISEEENNKYKMLTKEKITLIRFNVDNLHFDLMQVIGVIFNFYVKQKRYINKNKLVPAKIFNIVF